MSITVEGLLTFSSPSPSAFSKFIKPITDSATSSPLSSSVDTNASGRSASPPRKIRRLAHDSDSQSASRSLGLSLDSGKGKQPAKSASSQIKDGVIRVTLPEPHHTPQDHINRAAREVKDAINVLLSTTSKSLTHVKFECVFAACRTVVLFGTPGEALEIYQKDLSQNLGRCVRAIAADLEQDDKQGVAWLIGFVQKCAWFDKRVILLESILSYFDRGFLLEHKELQSIRDLAWQTFDNKIFGEFTIPLRLRNSIKDWITWERKHERAHDLRQIITRTIEYLEAHNQYEVMFERCFLDETANFYKAESAELVKKTFTGKPVEFLAFCQKRIDQEDTRGREILPEKTRAPAVHCTLTSLLEDQVQWLAKQGIHTLMASRTEDDVITLSKWYKTFSRINALPLLSAAFASEIKTIVTAIVKEDEKMVERLLDFKGFVDRATQEAFADEDMSLASAPALVPEPPASPTLSRAGGPSSPTKSRATAPAPVHAKLPNKDFTYAAQDAFSKAFKSRRLKPAEMIAKYLDEALRRGQGTKSDDDFQKLLDEALLLYRFTDDKDVFRAYYMRGLAKRLLLEKSASDDFEATILRTLKEKYDPEFGLGEHMFKDLERSRELTRDFKSKGELAKGSAQILDVRVLQSSSWPFAPNIQKVALPKWMMADLGKFTDYYKVKHQGRKLDWDFSRATVRMIARFEKGRKELGLSLYQAVILLLFNDEDTLTLEEIREQTQLEDDDLRRTLQTLACARKKVLLKKPRGKDVNDGDAFSFNAEFEDPKILVNIPSFHEKETVQEATHAVQGIEGDRRHYLEAAIVRIMKAKRQIGYEDLKTTVIESVQKHYVPTVDDIKSRIEYLIEQDYMKRDEENRKKFIYVA